MGDSLASHAVNRGHSSGKGLVWRVRESFSLISGSVARLAGRQGSAGTGGSVEVP